MSLTDEINAMTEAHGFSWTENETGNKITIQGHSFLATVEASIGEDGVEFEASPPDRDKYPEVINSLLGLAVEILVDRFAELPTDL